MPDTSASRREARALDPRPLGPINWIGLWTLYQKEVWRFLKVGMQTVAAPVVTTLLFLAVFVLAMGHSGTMIGDVPFMEFLAPGLVMMAITQNAFANTSSSLIIGKVQGNIVDVLMPPLGPGELVVAWAAGGVTRGLFVGIAAAIGMWVVVPFAMPHPGFAIFFAISGSLMLALLGVLGGLWAEKFDHLSAMTNFVITPLAFLSGTFYSVERLPEAWRFVAHLNPFFYMIDGFRYGFIGHADGNLAVGVAVLTVINVSLWLVVDGLVRRGYRLKA
ncbi:MAG: multidrug ABC transporter permease [Alphaproteobacteria bacterium]|nr:multidrug ABC transporter permease [Alphaproteobacteria bacterium]